METWDFATLDVPAHQPRILRSDDGAARAIALHLPGGESLQEHEVHEHAYVVVVSGEADVSAADGTVRAAAGAVFHFTPHERHTVTARSDVRLLLVLAPWPGEGHPGSVH
jgi:quercetin dioxygenase-like cupin family protein